MNRFVLALILILPLSFLYSQPSTCGGPTVSNTCGTSCVMCGDIDGMMITTLDHAGGDLPPDFCTGFHHTSTWIGFIAGSTSLSFDAEVGACNVGTSTELGVYEGCDCSNYSLVSNCNTAMFFNNTYSFTATPLEVGKYYWMVFDGNGESACDVTFHVTSGSTGTGPITVGPITGKTSVCLNNQETYSIPELGACHYNWTVSGGGLFASSTDNNSVTVQWIGSGTFDLCVEPELVCQNTAPECISVTVVAEGVPTEIDPVLVCEGETYEHDSEIYGVGEHRRQYESSIGCDSFILITVNEIPISRVQVQETMCAPDCYIINNQSYCTTGDYEVTVMQTNTPFCDSIIELSLNILHVEAIINVPNQLGCDNPSVIIDSYDSVIDGNGITIYEWLDSNGNVVSNDPQFIVTSAGTYSLRITITADDGSISCFDLDNVDIMGSTEGPALEFSDPIILCKGDSVNLDTLNIIDLNSVNGVVTYHSSSPPDTSNLLLTTVVSPNQPTNYYVMSSTGDCSDVLTINVNLGPDIVFNDTLRICNGDGVELSLLNIIDNNNSSSTITYHSGTPADANNIISDTNINPNTNTVIYVLAINENCLDEIPVIIEVGSSPLIQFVNQYELNCNNSSIRINPNITVTGNLNVIWKDKLGIRINLPDSGSIVVQDTGWYYIEAFGDNPNCIGRDSIFITENFDLPSLSTDANSNYPCGVPSVQLTGTTDFSFSGLEWYWSTANGSIISDPNSDQIDIDAPGLYYFIIRNTNNGCIDTVEQTVVPDQNTPNLTTSAPETINCITTGVQLSATGVSNAGGNITYVWSTTNGVISSNPFLPTLDVLEPGTYRIDITDDANSCVNSSTITIDIDTISPMLSFPGDLILDCINPSVSVRPTQNENTSYMYQWTTSDGVLPSITNQYLIDINTPGTYLLNVLNPNNGCFSEEEITITQDASIPNATIATPDILTCQQTTLILDASASDMGSSYTFSWTSPDGNFVDLTNPQGPEINLEGIYTLVITNTDNNCVDSAQVTVLSNQDYPTISFNNPNSLGCENANTTIIATITSTSGHTSNWTTNGGNITTGTMSYTIIVDQQGIYTISVEDINSSCVSTDSISIVGTATGPTAFELDINNGVCFGDLANYSVLNIVGGISPYRAELNGDAIIIDQEQTLTPGDYILVVFDQNDCHISDTFTIEPSQQYPINIGLDFQITAGDPTILIPQFGFDTTIISTLQWMPSNAVSCDNCLTTNFIGRHSTEVSLHIITMDGCESRADILITVVPGKDVFIPSAFSPNSDKLNDFFTVYSKSGRVLKVKSLSVYNRWGDQVFNKANFDPNIEHQGWDGKFRGIELDPAVFIFQTEVIFIDGSTKVFSGDITLIK